MIRETKVRHLKQFITRAEIYWQKECSWDTTYVWISPADSGKWEKFEFTDRDWCIFHYDNPHLDAGVDYYVWLTFDESNPNYVNKNHVCRIKIPTELGTQTKIQNPLEEIRDKLKSALMDLEKYSRTVERS